MIFNYTHDLMISFALGLIAGIAFCYWLLAKRSKRNIALEPQKKTTKEKPLPTTTIKNVHASLRQNLDVDKTVLNLDEILTLLDKYQQEPNTQLLQLIHKKIQNINEKGNNVLHEYLQQEHVDMEILEKIVEIEPELLMEANTADETALHIAIHQHHQEVIEWLMEEKHFENHTAFEHFLAHHDNRGETALHAIIEESWLHLSAHAYLEAFFHMLQKHPVGALFWKDGTGKTVYEHYFANAHADGRKLVEALIHKGILVHRNNHLELASEAIREQIAQAQENEPHEIDSMLHLLVNYYPQTLHEGATQTAGPNAITPGNSAGHKNYKPPEPS